MAEGQGKLENHLNGKRGKTKQRKRRTTAVNHISECNSNLDVIFSKEMFLTSNTVLIVNSGTQVGGCGKAGFKN